MPRKLFLVDVRMDFEMVVEAEDEKDAEWVAQCSVQEEMESQDQPDIAVVGRATMENVPEDWLDSYAYNKENLTPKTCREILRESEPEKELEEPESLSLFPEGE